MLVVRSLRLAFGSAELPQSPESCEHTSLLDANQIRSLAVVGKSDFRWRASSGVGSAQFAGNVGSAGDSAHTGSQELFRALNFAL